MRRAIQYELDTRGLVYCRDASDIRNKNEVKKLRNGAVFVTMHICDKMRHWPRRFPVPGEASILEARPVSDASIMISD